MKPSPAADRAMGPIGGQALLEGVMMRCGDSWGAAVRRDDGSIVTTQRNLPAGLSPWRRVPLVRGVIALAESTALGTQATLWAASKRSSDTEADTSYSKGGLAAAALVAMLLAIGIFGLLPAVVVKAAGIHNTFLFSLAEGSLRLTLLVGYMLLLARSPQVQRVFGYHGAEHMTIHAYEHGNQLDPSSVCAHDRRHPRCGTSFLLLVVALTIVAHVMVGTPSWGVLVMSRLLGLPLIAALAYETIRIAGIHRHQWFGRWLMAPGYWLQGVTTRVPERDMIEVAIAALEATLEVDAVPAHRVVVAA